jgi:hypothetical protein
MGRVRCGPKRLNDGQITLKRPNCRTFARFFCGAPAGVGTGSPVIADILIAIRADRKLEPCSISVRRRRESTQYARIRLSLER